MAWRQTYKRKAAASAYVAATQSVARVGEKARGGSKRQQSAAAAQTSLSHLSAAKAMGEMRKAAA